MHGRGWHGGLSGRAGWVDVGDGGGGGDAVARAGRVDAVRGAYEFGSVDADDGCAWELWDGECRDADGVVGVGESDAVIELGRCPVGACDRGCRGGGGDLGCPGLIVTGVGGTGGEGAEKVRLRARRKLPVVPLCVCAVCGSCALPGSWPVTDIDGIVSARWSHCGRIWGMMKRCSMAAHRTGHTGARQ